MSCGSNSKATISSETSHYLQLVEAGAPLGPALFVVHCHKNASL
jgi:hypothetical protein